MAKRNNPWTIAFDTQKYKNRIQVQSNGTTSIPAEYGRIARGGKDFPSIYWVNKRSDTYVGGF
jgi:hypothetical protein